MSDEKQVNNWIEVDQDDEHQLAKLQRGLYWVVIEGDWEPGEAGHMLYDFPSYITMFTISDFDDDTGVPIGSGDHDEEWEQVQGIWHEPIFKPGMPSEYE